jgi:hypothetical protein
LSIAGVKASFNELFTVAVEKRMRLEAQSLGRQLFAEVSRASLGKGEGCDIGYALAANSCEEANSVDARTVTALDAITAFAVPNPNCSSQS